MLKVFPSSSSWVLLISISIQVFEPVLTSATQNRRHSICRAWVIKNLSICITVWQNRHFLHPFLILHPSLAVCRRLSWPQLNHSFLWLSSSWRVWSSPAKAGLYQSFNIFLLMVLILFFSTGPKLCIPFMSRYIWEIIVLEHHQVYFFRFYSRSSIVNVWLLEVVLCQSEHVAPGFCSQSKWGWKKKYNLSWFWKTGVC